MGLKEKLARLAAVNEDICVTISLNTHRTHPDHAQDQIVLRKLVSEARDRLIAKFGKRRAEKVLGKLDGLPEKIDESLNQESLHIFVSDDVSEVVRLIWPTDEDRVYIGGSFDVAALVNAVERTEKYLVMALSQGGVNLYRAVDDGIVEEVRNNDFPFAATPYYAVNNEQRSDSGLMDDLVREYFNSVDKALVRVCRQKDMKCVVIATRDNYSKLLQVADDPGIYVGWAAIDYNNVKEHRLAQQAWEVIRTSI